MRGAILGVAVLCSLTALAAAQESPGSYLIQYHRTADGKYLETTVPYEPQPGDLVFFNDHKRHWIILYKLVGSDAPYHAALVFRKPNGEFATAEAGPDDTLHCRVLPLIPRLQGFRGDIHIRRVKQPITKERDEALTNWAMAQDGKRYALARLLLQATPIRCRGPLRKQWFGATYLDRSAYLCAELAVAGGTVAGLFDPTKHLGNAIYPRDIIYNDINDLSALFHDAELWTSQPIVTVKE